MFACAGSANILYKDKGAVFYNPVQEFNRDMSIMMIKLFQDMREKEGNYLITLAFPSTPSPHPLFASDLLPHFYCYISEKGRKIRVLEALTATGMTTNHNIALLLTITLSIY